MGIVIRFPRRRRHARASASSGMSWKSSAEIKPPLQSFNLAIVGQSGLDTFRRIRLIVARVQPISAATPSSDKPRSAMYLDKCAMPDLYIKRTNPVKPDCTDGDVYVDKSIVHDAYMPASTAKKIIPKVKEPKFKPTFIKQWRKHRGLTQEKLAEEVSKYFAARGRKKGYTHASIQRLESGKSGYTQLTLEALADVLGTDTVSLLIRDPDKNPSLWAIWERALPAERAEIEDHAEIVLKKARR